MDAGRGRGRGRGRGVAAAGRGAAVVGAAGRGAVGAGRGAAGRGAAGRGAAVPGGAAGRGGRGAGRGLPEAEVSAESAAPSVGTASVTQSVSLGAGHGAGVGVGRGAGVGVDAGAGAAPGFGGVAPAQGDLIVGLLTQLLARLPEAVPQQAPVAPPAAGAQAGAGVIGQQQAAGFVEQVEQQAAAGFAGQHGAAVADLPSYRESMREMQRMGTPTFEGGVTPEQADEWRQRLERNFESILCPEEFQVQLAVHYLGGDAHLWWRSVRTSRTGWTWVDFVEEFNYKFFPQEARDRFQLRFLELSQGERSVREYDAEFSRLLVHADIGGMSERTLMGKFLQGLRQDIKKLCRGGMYHTRAELVELAASTEEDLREPVRAAAVPAAVASATQPRGQHQQQQRRNFSSGYGRGSRPQHGQKRRAEEISASSQSGACFGCGSLDHRVSACPKRAASIERAVCYHCRETGHIRPMCPKLQQRTVGSVAAVQPLAIQSAAQVAALQPGSGGAPRVYTPQEAGQTSQSGQITGIILIQTS